MRNKLKIFMAGFIFAIGLLVSVGAAAATINVQFNNAKVFISGKEQILKDANGNIVKPLLFNGTNYIPIRAVSTSLNKVVNWEPGTGNVYIDCYPYTIETLPTGTFDTPDGFTIKIIGQIAYPSRHVYIIELHNKIGADVFYDMRNASCPFGSNTYLTATTYDTYSGYPVFLSDHLEHNQSKTGVVVFENNYGFGTTCIDFMYKDVRIKQ